MPKKSIPSVQMNVNFKQTPRIVVVSIITVMSLSVLYALFSRQTVLITSDVLAVFVALLFFSTLGFIFLFSGLYTIFKTLQDMKNLNPMAFLLWLVAGLVIASLFFVFGLNTSVAKFGSLLLKLKDMGG